MLSKKSIQAAGVITASLENLVVTPINGTPVDQLTTMVMQGVSDTSGDAVQQLHQGSMLPTMMGPNDTNQPSVAGHDIASEQYVALLSESIGEHFRFARHVANPAINTVVNAVVAQIGQRAPMHNLSKFQLASIHLSQLAAQLVGKYANYPVQEVQLFANFPERDEADLVEACRTGSGEFDSDLQNMLADLPVGWITQVYHQYFIAGGYLNVGRDLDRCDELLIVHLLALSLDNNPPQGVAMSLPEYNVRITAIAAQAANALHDIYRRYDRLVLNGALVWKLPPIKAMLESDADGAVIVLGPVYDAFVADGGTPEVIFGAAVTDREGNRDKLLANKESYLLAYDRYVQRQTRARNENLARIAKDYAAAEISKVAIACEQYLPEGTDLIAVQRLVKQQIETLSGQELLDNTYIEIRRVLCNSVFAHTDVLKILTRLEEFSAKNPGVTPAKAATYAAISLLVEHQLSQVMVG